MKRYIAHCPACRLTTSGSASAVRWDTFPAHALWDLVLDCRGCGRPLSATMVRVAARSSYRCGDQCVEATGADCACDCEGRNHGIAFEAIRRVS